MLRQLYYVLPSQRDALRYQRFGKRGIFSFLDGIQQILGGRGRNPSAALISSHTGSRIKGIPDTTIDQRFARVTVNSAAGKIVHNNNLPTDVVRGTAVRTRQASGLVERTMPAGSHAALDAGLDALLTGVHLVVRYCANNGVDLTVGQRHRPTKLPPRRPSFATEVRCTTRRCSGANVGEGSVTAGPFSGSEKTNVVRDDGDFYSPKNKVTVSRLGESPLTKLIPTLSRIANSHTPKILLAVIWGDGRCQKLWHGGVGHRLTDPWWNFVGDDLAASKSTTAGAGSRQPDMGRSPEAVC